MDGAPTLDQLPGALLVLIFLLVPVDTRMRCAEVCRKWRALLADTRLWTTLDLSRAARLNKWLTEALLSAAVRRADGQLVRLDIDDVDVQHLGTPALLCALAPSVASLRELHIHRKEDYFGLLNLSGENLRGLVGALPSLTRVECGGVTAQAAVALPLLRAEPPFGALVLRGLRLTAVSSMTLESWHAVCSAVEACFSLEALHLFGATLDLPVAAAVVDAALTCRLKHVGLTYCAFSDESVSALARLLREGVLEVFGIHTPTPPHLPLGELTHALRANTTLRSLTLRRIGLWDDVRAGVALLGALMEHPTPRNLDLSGNTVGDDADGRVAGDALAALVEANSPALTHLEVTFSDLQDATLASLIAALRFNTHLHRLNIHGNKPSPAFARNVLEPAKVDARKRAPQPLLLVT